MCLVGMTKQAVVCVSCGDDQTGSSVCLVGMTKQAVVCVSCGDDSQARTTITALGQTYNYTLYIGLAAATLP